MLLFKLMLQSILGNSGGALVNSKGEVIGLNTLKLAGTGIEGMGFSIPINNTIAIYDELIKNGKVLRPYIGIAGIDLDETTAKRYNLPVGVYVRSVEDFSSAQKSGIKAGDVITKVDGKQIKTMDEINEIKATKKVDDKIELELTRNNENVKITLTLSAKP